MVRPLQAAQARVRSRRETVPSMMIHHYTIMSTYLYILVYIHPHILHIKFMIRSYFLHHQTSTRRKLSYFIGASIYTLHTYIHTYILTYATLIERVPLMAHTIKDLYSIHTYLNID